MPRPIKKGHHPDYFFLALIFIITVFGLVMLTSASSELGKIKFNDSYYYLKHQIYNGFIIGIIGFIIASKINYQRYKKLALILLIASLGILALVFTNLGVTSGGATRWLDLGPIRFQPAELLKISFILYLGSWLGNQRINRARSFSEGFLPLLIIYGATAALIFFQRSTSMAVIILGAGTIVYFLSGAKLKYLFYLFIIGAVVLSALIYLTPYRLQRVVSFLNSGNDPLRSDYHLNEAKTAIGSGGIFGVGYGESRTKAAFLPAPIDDSIFAVTAEELGFIGGGALVALFGTLVIKMLLMARKIRDQFGQLLLIGFASVIGIQSLIHVGAISGVLPLTGVPLPFISYGGTALAVFLIMSGISLNVSKYTQN